MFYEMIGFAPPEQEDAEGKLGRPDFDRLALFLDFDGTVVQIAETPDGVEVGDRLVALLNDLHRLTSGALAIVTGRGCEQIARLLPGYSGRLYGSHGAERRVEGVTYGHPLSGSDQVERLSRLIRDFAELDPAFVFEQKPVGAVLHYRRNPDLDGEAYRFVESLTGMFPAFELHPAKLAIEMRPADANKRAAVAACMETPPFAGRAPAYFGDDITDEPALAWVAEQGGLAVKVGAGNTNANYRIETVEEVLATLARWVDGHAAEG